MRLTVVQLGDIRIMLIKNQLGPALSKSFFATLPAGTGTVEEGNTEPGG
jgi:hypothetical protein